MGRRDNFIMIKRKCETSPSHKQRAAKVDVIIQDEIGAKLRQLYSNMVEEPVPDRFLALLKRLEEGGKRDTESLILTPPAEAKCRQQ